MGRCGTVAQDVENSGGSLKIGRSGKYAVEGNCVCLPLAVPLLVSIRLL